MGQVARAERAEQELEDKAKRFWDIYFCGCGNPEAAIGAFREILELFEARADGCSPYLNIMKWQAYEEKHGMGLVYCILYWLNGMGLAEHGGSVGGSWLSPLGERIWMDVMTSTDQQLAEEL